MGHLGLVYPGLQTECKRTNHNWIIPNGINEEGDVRTGKWYLHELLLASLDDLAENPVD